MDANVTADIAPALDALDAAVDEVLGLSFAGLSVRQMLSVLARLERVAWRLPVPGQALVARLAREATPADLGGYALKTVLAAELRIGVGTAGQRIADAMALAPRVGITGEELPPVLAATAAAQLRGEVGPEQVEIVRDVMSSLPHGVSTAKVTEAESQMAGYATTFGPAQCRNLGTRLVDTIAPDGDFDPEERERTRARKRGFTIGPQGVDGLSRVSGYVTPEWRATMEPVLHKNAAPGMCNPDDATPCTAGTPTQDQIDNDHRSLAQRNHDAVMAMGRSVLASGVLGQHHGLPATIIVSTSLQDLENAAGFGVSAGGTLVPMRDVIRLASHAYHHLAIFDKATELPLNLFRTKRCASEAQRIVLHAKDRGCTFPGCTAPAYLCEAHHIDDYALVNDTNIDNLTLACRLHHKLVTPGGWITRLSATGRVQWIPPPEADRGQARTNDYHHPERILGQVT